MVVVVSYCGRDRGQGADDERYRIQSAANRALALRVTELAAQADSNRRLAAARGAALLASKAREDSATARAAREGARADSTAKILRSHLDTDDAALLDSMVTGWHLQHSQDSTALAEAHFRNDTLLAQHAADSVQIARQLVALGNLQAHADTLLANWNESRKRGRGAFDWMQRVLAGYGLVRLGQSVFSKP